MLMLCVSGVAIDKLLFSRVGSPLCHRYRLISRTGSHPAFRGTYLRSLWSFIEDRDAAGGRQGPRGLDRRVSARMVKSTDRSVSRGRRSRRLKASVSANKGCRLSERPSSEISSIQALMELTLPRFTMSEGIRGKHSPWPVAKEAPASPSPNRNELTVKVPRCSSTQQVVHSVYFDLDALASSSEDELVDAKRCKDMLVTVLYKPEEYDTPAESKMSASDFVNRLESGAGDVRKVVQNRNEPTDSQKGLPMRPRSRHELSAPTVDLITGKCIPGKMIRTASPLTVDMTVSCRPEPEYMQQGVNADGLPLTESVGVSVADVNTSTAVATPPGLGGSDEGLTSKKSQLDDWSELLPSLGGGGGGGRPPRPHRPRLRCRGALQKARHRRFRPIVCRRVNRR